MKKMYPSPAKRTLRVSVRSAFALSVALLAIPAAHAQVNSNTPKLEAESAVLTGGAVVSTVIQPASNGSFVDYNGSPSSATFTYTAAAAGYHDIVIRYESQYGTKLGDLVVNGGTRSEVYFNSTQTGATFRSTTARRILLNAGANTIEIARGYNYYGIDYIQVAPSATNVSLTPTAAGRVEAEAGQLFATQAFVRDGDTTPHSGATYVSGFNEVNSVGSFIKMPVDIATAGTYQVVVSARGLFDAKSFDLVVQAGTVAGGPRTTQLGLTSASFAPFTVANYALTAGINTLTITSRTAFIDVDYVDITPTTSSPTATLAGAAAQRALTVYPNPSNGQALNVGLASATARTASIELVNALGQRVLATSRTFTAGDNQFVLHTDGLAAGLYQLVVRSGDQPVLSHRVVIN